MIFTAESMKTLFDIFEMSRGVEQSEIHHPEGDVFNHSVQVLNRAFRESHDTDLILAAMFHDIGKVTSSHGHEKYSIDMMSDYLSVKSLWLIEHHMRIWSLLLGNMKRKTKVDTLVNHVWLPELIMLARWDKIGRNPHIKIKYCRQNILERFQKCIDDHFKTNNGRAFNWSTNQDNVDIIR